MGRGTAHRLTSCYPNPSQNVMATTGMTCLCGDYMGWPADGWDPSRHTESPVDHWDGQRTGYILIMSCLSEVADALPWQSRDAGAWKPVIRDKMDSL